MSPVHDINTGLLVEPTAGFFDGENASTKDLQHLKGLISNAVGRQDVLAKRVEELENQLRVLGASTSRTLIPRYLEHSSQIRALEQRADRAEQGHLTNELRITELECLSPHAGNPRAPTRAIESPVPPPPRHDNGHHLRGRKYPRRLHGFYKNVAAQTQGRGYLQNYQGNYRTGYAQQFYPPSPAPVPYPHQAAPQGSVMCHPTPMYLEPGMEVPFPLPIVPHYGPGYFAPPPPWIAPEYAPPVPNAGVNGGHVQCQKENHGEEHDAEHDAVGPDKPQLKQADGPAEAMEENALVGAGDATTAQR